MIASAILGQAFHRRHTQVSSKGSIQSLKQDMKKPTRVACGLEGCFYDRSVFFRGTRAAGQEGRHMITEGACFFIAAVV
jgi:hypothetical protein